MSEKNEDKLLHISSLIGRHAPSLGRELEELICHEKIEEIRIRREGRSAVRTSSGNIQLTSRFDAQLSELLSDSLDGSLFSQRANIADGYVTMSCGVRVGVIGRASYDGELVGIRDISALIFRIPSHGCPFSEQMYRVWAMGGRGGVLVISPPFSGKSTALFAFLCEIAEKEGKRTVLVDERCESDSKRLSEAGVDVMRGYRRGRGLEIAVRTMSPEIVACDEIYTKEDVSAVMSAYGTGVTVIASAHAEDRADTEHRAVLREPLSAGVFKWLFTVGRRGGEFCFSPQRLC